MKKTLNLSFGLLILLTFITALISNTSKFTEFAIGLIMAISAIKFILVSFQFMELKKANIFWKISLLFILVLITLPIILIFI
ncbi:MAG: cytochrome C oxidase subunit IV family protein [Flavobacterium sp.]